MFGGELVPALTRLRASGGTRVILGVRDILDDPERIKSKWARDGTAKIVRELYDEVFIYGDPQIYPTAELYEFDDLLNGNATYCGYVSSVRQAEVRRASGTGRRHVVVSGGGGRDAYPVLAASLDALELIRAAKRPEMTLVGGPLMDGELRDHLRTRAEQLGAAFLDSTGRMPELLAAADLLVTMGGYNSVTEAIAIRCPTIVVPRVGPSSEQRLRAECLARLGLVRSLPGKPLMPDQLAPMLVSRRPDNKSMPDIALNGAARAAELILNRLPAARAAPARTPAVRSAHA